MGSAMGLIRVRGLPHPAERVNTLPLRPLGLPAAGSIRAYGLPPPALPQRGLPLPPPPPAALPQWGLKLLLTALLALALSSLMVVEFLRLSWYTLS